MNILIIGACSEIAQTIINHHQEKDKIYLIDHPSKEKEIINYNLNYNLLDVLDSVQIERYFQDSNIIFDQLYYLVGINIMKNGLAFTPEEWDKVMDTNLKSYYFITREFVRKNIQNKTPATIVSIGSQHGTVANAYRTPYCVSKAGLIHLTKVLALELSMYNIRVNCVSPGFIFNKKSKDFLNHPDVKREYLQRIPLKSFITPQEVGQACIFLNSSRFITGHNLIIDGGYTIW